MKIVYLTAEWCSACKAMKPSFEKKMEKLNISFRYVDVESDEGDNFSRLFGIRNLPTLLFFGEDNVYIGKESGNTAVNEIEKYL